MRHCGACCLLLLGRLLLMSAIAPTDQSQAVQCGHPAHKEICFEEGVKSKLVFAELSPAVIRCVVRNLGRHVVTWMRNDGHDLPLTIGKTVFTGDKRVMIDYSSPDEWNLVIRRVHVQDSGEYLCQVTADGGHLMEKTFMLVVQESESDADQSPTKTQQRRPQLGGIRSSDQSVDAAKRLLSDDPDKLAASRREKNVQIFGRRLVVVGEQFVSLTCTAIFRSPDAKRNSAASVEWYHRGLPQASNASSMDVSMSWKDGDTAVSVLTLYSVGPSHSGEWLCLKRPSEAPDGGLETARHRLTVLDRDYPDQQQQKQRQQSQSELLGLVRSRGDRPARPALASLVLIAAVLLFSSCLSGAMSP